MQPGTDTAVIVQTFDECDRKADRLRRGYVAMAMNVVEEQRLGERVHDEDVKMPPTDLPTDLQGRYQQMRKDTASVLKYATTILSSRTG